MRLTWAPAGRRDRREILDAADSDFDRADIVGVWKAMEEEEKKKKTVFFVGGFYQRLLKKKKKKKVWISLFLGSNPGKSHEKLVAVRNIWRRKRQNGRPGHQNQLRTIEKVKQKTTEAGSRT